MISKANGSVPPISYSRNSSEAKQVKNNVNTSQQSDVNKLKQLKESINSGEYKVNIEALAKKMADSLL